MCGIFGVFSRKEILTREIEACLAGLKHRGPDASGHSRIPNKGVLGMTRLAINGLTKLKNQPLSTEDGQVTLVFNGEIYNYKFIRAKLEVAGYSFSDGSDTEVVLRSYQFWGRDCFEHLHGMFAIAIWDNKKQELILCRDSFGEKPLYFCEQEDSFQFCSSRQLIQMNSNVIDLYSDLETLAFHTLGYLPQSHSSKIIDEVTPGFYYVVKDNSITERIPYKVILGKHKIKESSSLKEYAKELDELLKEVVEEIFDASDVPTGVFMSGGVDSSLIAKKACEVSPDVKLFTVAFSESDYDESKNAAKIAEKIGGHHEIVHINYSKNLILDAIKSLDIPISDTSIIPFYALSKYASRTHKVCLSGDGGDELFGGYVTYQATILNQGMKGLIPSTPILKKLSELIPAKQGNVDITYKLRAFLLNCDKNSKIAHQFWRRIFTEAELQELIPSIRNIKKLDLEEIWNESEASSLIQQAMDFDQRTWLRYGLLVKSDRMSMANSLEVRSPFLHPKIVGLSRKLPDEFKVNLYQRKIILKEIANMNFGPSLMSSAKRGFGSPISNWISNNPDDFRDMIFASKLYSEKAVEKLFVKHIGKRADNSYKIFALCVWSIMVSEARNA